MPNQKKIGVLFSYITLAANMIIQFVYTPVMLRLLGQSEYGLYTLSNSIISYLTLFDMGFAGSYLRFYSTYKVKEDEEAINKLNSTFLALFLILSTAALLCGIVLTTKIEYIFNRNLTIEELTRAKIIMLILSVSLAFNLLGNVFSSIITAHERFLELRVVKLLQTIFSPLIAIPLMLMGYGSIAIAIASLITSLWCFVDYARYCFLKINVKFNLKCMSKTLIKDVGKFSFYIFLNEIISQINWSVDKVLLGIYYGTAMTAIYGVGSQIDTVYRSLSSSISSVFVPHINRIVAQGDDNVALTELFCRIGRIQFVVLAPVLLGFIGFGEMFVKLWAGAEYGNSYYVTLLLIVPVTVPLMQNIGIEIQRAKNKHQFRSIIYSIMAVANVLVSIPLCKMYGAVGCAIGTSISLFVGNVLVMNWFYYKKLGINIKQFWKEIFEFKKSLLLPVLYIAIIMIIPIKWNVVVFIILALLFVALYTFCIWLWGINNYEKSVVMKIVNKIRR